MTQGIAELALIYALPLGISFVTLFTMAATSERNTKIVGVIISILTIVVDCLFYFVKNTVIAQNVEGGLLLSFFLLFLFSLLCLVHSEEWSTRISFLLISMCMLTGLVGTACYEHPTLVFTSSYSVSEQDSQVKKYDNMPAFDKANLESKDFGAKKSTAHSNSNDSDDEDEAELAPEVIDRLESYTDKAETVIEKMNDIMRSISSFEPIEQNISEMNREKRSQQALAINSKASTVNRKAIGLFHPLQAREAHSELVQASETIRSASHELYTYCLLEDPAEQAKKFSQTHEMIAIAKKHIDQFNKIIQNLTNNQPQQ